jgi:hypothetical protein
MARLLTVADMTIIPFVILETLQLTAPTSQKLPHNISIIGFNGPHVLTRKQGRPFHPRFLKNDVADSANQLKLALKYKYTE